MLTCSNKTEQFCGTLKTICLCISLRFLIKKHNTKWEVSLLQPEAKRKACQTDCAQFLHHHQDCKLANIQINALSVAHMLLGCTQHLPKRSWSIVGLPHFQTPKIHDYRVYVSRLRQNIEILQQISFSKKREFLLKTEVWCVLYSEILRF